MLNWTKSIVLLSHKRVSNNILKITVGFALLPMPFIFPQRGSMQMNINWAWICHWTSARQDASLQPALWGTLQTGFKHPRFNTLNILVLLKVIFLCCEYILYNKPGYKKLWKLSHIWLFEIQCLNCCVDWIFSSDSWRFLCPLKFLK